MQTIRVLDRNGDSPFQITDEASRAQAKQMFETLLGNGHVAMRMEGQQGTPIKKFEDIGTETLMLPQLQAG